MKEYPDLDEMIIGIQNLIESDDSSSVRRIHVETLTDILAFLKELAAIKAWEEI